MRSAVLVCLLLTAASGWLFLAADSPAEAPFEIPPLPANLLGYAVVNEPRANLALLREIRLEALELDARDLEAGVSPVLDGLEQLAATGAPHLWILIHGLERRPDAPGKIHFSLLVRRSPEREAQLEEAVRGLAESLFQAPARLLEDGRVRLLLGPSPRQTLYQVRLPRWLVISNSEQGWKQTLDVWAGRAPSQASRAAYRNLRRRFDFGEGIFVYGDGRQVLPLLPEFGYQLRRRPWGLEDEFFPLPSEESAP